jgi:hypothetical protein
MNDPRPPFDTSPARVQGARASTYTLLLNALPLAYVVCAVAAVLAVAGWPARIVVGLAWIYLLPPLLVRVSQALWGSPEGRDLTQDTRAYKLWWFATQMQVPFNRFPMLEEALRLAPGLYALWLRLWGARVSTRVYWAAGVIVTDRNLIDVGLGAVIGTRAILASHLGFKDEHGAFRVTVARLRIEDEALIGAYAGLGPGCRIEAGAEVPVAAFLRPFTDWQSAGRRHSHRPRRYA